MKIILVDPDILVPGTTDVLVDPETDVLSDEDDPVVFVENEPVLVRFVNSLYTADGMVRKIHEDEMGSLVQVSVDWAGVWLQDE